MMRDVSGTAAVRASGSRQAVVCRTQTLRTGRAKETSG